MYTFLGGWRRSAWVQPVVRLFSNLFTGFHEISLIEHVVEPSGIRESSEVSSESEAPTPAHVAVRHLPHTTAACGHLAGKAPGEETGQVLVLFF